ncbi:hypothetical protein GYMLUDRAFT_244636 [Collybiopsis luxurians FD-317 M1]|uniref:Uncharacterized protein n=1 Tax=Collybiopsis luxurians FD-317 M1 TaxID=944289 RepID=A0A0D0B9B2_9AGAR|nr:hypothetical protein GYMLUDRAFT_244636 [Collybiopsis luxurians FD-317 M1]
MSPEEIALFQSLGLTLGRNGSVMLFIGILYGIYVITAYMTLKSLLRRGLTKNVAIWILLFVVAFTFMMTTTAAALYFQNFFQYVQVSLVENPTLPVETRFQIAGDSIAGLATAFQWLGGVGGGFIYIIGDAVTVWRVWVICPSQRKLASIPVFLVLAAFGCSIGFNILNTPPPPFVFTGSALWILQLLGLILPLATNVVATGIIGYQAFAYKGFLKANLNPQHSKAGSILILLTESGVVYSLAQAIYVTLVLTDDAPLSSPQDQATRLFDQFTLFLSRSITDTIHGTYSASPGAGSDSLFDPGTHISFAERDAFSHSGTLEASEHSGPQIDHWSK